MLKIKKNVLEKARKLLLQLKQPLESRTACRTGTVVHG